MERVPHTGRIKMKTRILAMALLLTASALFGCSKNDSGNTANSATVADSVRAAQAADSALARQNAAASAAGATGQQPAAAMSPAEKGERDLPPGKAPAKKPSSGNHKSGGSSSNSGDKGGSAGSSKPAAPKYATVAGGTVGGAALSSELSSETAKEGDEFTATLSDPLLADGAVVVPAGAKVLGHVTAANSTGRGKTKASLAVAFDTIELADGSKLELTAKPQTWEAAGNTKGDIVKTGAGALIGGLIGGAAGDTKKGVLLGGAAGAGLAVASRGEPVVLKAGAKLKVVLAEALQVPVK